MNANSNTINAMKDLYCCPLMRSGTFDLRKVMLSIVVVMAFVLNGSAANIYMEDSESNSQSVQVNNNVGSSVDNLLNLSTKLDAAAQWLAFTSDGSTMSKLAASPVVCPCPKNTAPVLSVSSQAFDLECIGEIPAPPIVTANDDCDGPVNVQEFYFTNELGETHCTLADAHGDISTYWSVWLPSLPDGFTDQWILTNEGGSIDLFADGSGIISGHVRSITNPNRKWRMHVRIENGLDWNAWNSLITISPPYVQRTYKDDAGYGAAGGNLWETWMYYTIDPNNSYLVGEGELTGAYLNLKQAPSSRIFGVQIGEAANNTNANYGLSTWFYYTGFLPNASGQLVAASGIGDINVDADCGQPQYQCATEVNYTYVAIDQCGLASTATLTYNVEDTEAPVLTGCPVDVQVQCGEVPPVAVVTALDNCIGVVPVTFAEQITDGGCPQEMIITRVWAAEDSCQNRMECVQVITVVDTMSPVFGETPEDMTIECGSEIPPMMELSATDNCDNEVTITMASSISQGECPIIEMIHRSWTASDDCGNTTTVTQNIYIQDTTAPGLICAEDITVECNTSTDPSVTGTSLGTDVCGDVDVSYSDGPTAGSCPSSFVRTWTAVDDCGNSTTCAQTISIDDTIAPAISCPVDAIVECGDDFSPQSTGFASASDNCSSAINPQYVDGSISGTCPQTFTRTWTAVDDCGNSSSCAQMITIEDTTAPMIYCPGNAEVACGSSTDPSATGVAEAEDICSSASVSHSDGPISGTCPQSFVRTWTAIDECQNANSCVQTITIYDSVSPVIDCPDDATVECGSDSSPASTGTASATDACNDVTVSHSDGPTSGTCPQSFVRTWTAIDACQNVSTCTQTITIEDTTAPSITAAANITIECDEEVPAPSIVSSSDTCGDATWTSSDSFAPACGTTGSITRTYVATDDCGNTATAVQTITIVDTEAPVIIMPDDVIVDISCDDYSCGFQNGYLFIAGLLSPQEEAEFILCTQGLFAEYDILPLGVNDNCDDVQWAPTSFFPIVHPACTEYEGSSNVKVSFICWFNAIDDCGNAADSVYSVINIIDFTPPYFMGIPEDTTAECDNIDRSDEVTAMDDCDSELQFQYEEDEIPGDCIGQFTLIRTWSAVDACGNSHTQSQTIEVNDTTAPDFGNLPDDLTVECDEVPVPVATVTAIDNCDPFPTVSSSDYIIEGNCSGYYTIERTFVAVDDCGNSISYTQTINVQDTTAPEFVNPPANTSAECDDVPSAEDIETYDACGDVTVEYSEILFSGGCEGTLERTWIITDECGNSNIHIQYINLLDETAPVLSGVPADLTIECDQDAPEFNVTASDNCDDDVSLTMTSVTTPGCSEATYSITYTFTAEDNCENVTVDTYTLNVVDTTAPVITMGNVQEDLTCEEFPCGLDQLVAYANGTLSTTDAAQVRQCVRALFMQNGLVPVSVTDNCDDVEWVENNFSVDLLDCEDYAGMTNVKAVITCYFDAVDDCGNEAETAQTIITISDNTAPMLYVNNSATVECGESFDLVGFEAYDECGMVDVAIDSTFAADCGYTGVWTITYTATDMCGNSTVDHQTITIIDTTAPSLEVAADVTVECGSDIPAPSSATSDICGESSVEVSESFEPACGNTGIYHRTYTATDDCGNTTTAHQAVTVIDTTDPEFVNPPANTSAECDDVPAAEDIETYDACGDVTVEYSEILFSGGCEGNLQRTWIITDECGNSNIHIQYINLIDETAPVLEEAPADLTIECTDEYVFADLSASDNCDDDVDVTRSEVTSEGDCEYTITITWTAEDDCENTAVAVQVITVVDTTAPEFDSTPEDMTVDCQQVPAPEVVTATDACNSASVDMTETSTDGCPYTITRTYAASDACGNSAVHVQTITVVDTTAPVLSSYPEDMTVSCDDIPAAADVTVTDNCDDNVEIDYSTETIPGDCVYSIERTWSAVDACGNSVSHTQTITVVDTTAPIFDASSVPADMTVECDDVPAPASPTASDNCQDNVSISLSESEVAGECSGEKTITRTWTANDGCGNTASVSQTISLIDTTAPTFDEQPEDETYVCGDEIPAAPELTATDNCSSTVSIAFEADTVGNTNPYKDCDLTTGIPYSGETWSMFLNLDGTLRYYVLDGPARFEEVVTPAGIEGHITGTLVSPDNMNRSWEIDTWLINKADYNDWTSQLTISAPYINRLAKDFQGLATQADKESWDYYEVDGTRSKLIGHGTYEGDILMLTHAPASRLFGFQVGMNANGYNHGFGVGGWFFYSGVVDGTYRSGDGDFAFDAQCPPCEYTITRMWTATDDCGNESMTMQVINVLAPAAPTSPAPSANGARPESFGFTRAYPNPTSDFATVEYTVPVDGRVMIDIIDTEGRAMGAVFNGQAYAGRTNITTFDGTIMNNGMYVIRLITDNNVYFQKIMLSK